ncbi:hypothetical protein NP233_g11546 [Leucocoprinus birnbaumii]|uniref:Uncharacterized protein n=1 Tax=Leucocoprinus birnbaumii TaxID=56174 RepID=A0AAD5YQU7_9AGAR|nr:hypothetical protein NP233_g11546 [Leucocoprinus birnbaumii]
MHASTWRQKDSKYASTYPWKTTFLFDHELLERGAHRFEQSVRHDLKVSLIHYPIAPLLNVLRQRVLANVDRLEKRLLKDELFLAFVGVNSTKTYPSSFASQANALLALFVYRLIDTFADAFLLEPSPHTPVDTIASNEMGKLLTTKSQDWTAGVGLTEIQWDEHILWARQAMREHDQDAPLPNIVDTKSILEYVILQSATSLHASIASNLAAAASILSYLNDSENFELNSKSFQLPRTCKDLSSILKVDATRIDLSASFDLLGPTVFSVTFSPLVLFSPTNYCHSRMYATTITRVTKPAESRMLERLALRSWCAIAFLHKTPRQALAEFLEGVDTFSNANTLKSSQIKYISWDSHPVAENPPKQVASEDESRVAIPSLKKAEEEEEEGDMSEGFSTQEGQLREMMETVNVDTTTEESEVDDRSRQASEVPLNDSDWCPDGHVEDSNLSEEDPETTSTSLISREFVRTEPRPPQIRRQAKRNPKRLKAVEERDWVEPTGFDSLPKERYIPSVPLPLYDFVDHKVVEVRLSCHHRSHVGYLEDVSRAVREQIPQESLAHRGPRENSCSILKVYTAAQYAELTPEALLEGWRKEKRSMLVVDIDKVRQGSPEKFNLAAFLTRCPSFEMRPLGVYDYSVINRGMASRSKRQITISDLIACVSSPQTQRAVTSDEFPNTQAPSGMSANLRISLQDVAWRLSENSRAPRLSSYITSTRGAFTRWRMIRHGTAIAIEPEVGAELWCIGEPCNANMADKNAFTKIDSGEPPLRIKYIWLKYGMILVLRPLTPYRVITTQSSIVKYERLLVTHTLKDTCWGVLHTFASGRPVDVSSSETIHDWLRGILKAVLLTDPYPRQSQRMDPLKSVQYSPNDSVLTTALGKHRQVIPSIVTPDGIIDVIHVCSTLFFGCAVFPQVNQQPTDLSSYNLRERFMKGRDLALRVGHRIELNTDVAIDGVPVDFWQKFFYMLVARQAAVVYNNLLDLPTQNAENPPSLRFVSHINALAEEYPDFHHPWASTRALNAVKKLENLDWGDATISFTFVEAGRYELGIPVRL